MQKKNQLPSRYAKMGRWMGKTTVRDTESKNGLRVDETGIDLLAIGVKDKEYLVGECKFKGKPFAYSEYLDTKAKLSPMKEKAKFYYALFSESGFDKKIVDEAEQDNDIKLYNLSKIVNFNN